MREFRARRGFAGLPLGCPSRDQARTAVKARCSWLSERRRRAQVRDDRHRVRFFGRGIGSQRRGARSWRVRFLIPLSIRACGCRDRNRTRAPHGVCSDWPRFPKPLCDPGRSAFPSPVLVSALHAFFRARACPRVPRLKRWLAYTPCAGGLPVSSSQHASTDPGRDIVHTGEELGRDEPMAMSSLGPRAATAEYPGLLCPPRALPTVGETSWISSEGVTPPSQLIRAHAPDQDPPCALAFALCAGSLQVAASPCWEMALPDIISATLVQALGPIPRRAPRLLTSIPSPRTPAFTDGKTVGRADLPPQQLRRGADIGASVIRSPSGSCTRLAPRLLRPQRLSAGPPGLSHHA
jgi:hypothetical protein